VGGRMSLKEFLMPDWRKIVIFIILSILTNFGILLFALSVTGGDFGYFEIIGLPLGFYRIAPCSMGIRGIVCGEGFFSLTYLIINLIFWCFISCIIIWGYDRLKKKPEKKRMR
jgi:hypothetical protein